MTIPEWARAGRSGWAWDGSRRPPWAHPTGPGEESVWDYPRPPRLVADERRVVVTFAGNVVGDSTRSRRVLETASPPTFYLPPQDVRTELLRPAAGTTRCEWKGEASYWTVVLPDETLARRAAWSYREPFPEFESIRGWFSFYPSRVDCTVDGEAVRTQQGGFYGGWITTEVVGPFKGDPGAGAW